jgi:endonuclease/exonuclease/phosphatase (EEP) superfamily protein YafD
MIGLIAYLRIAGDRTALATILLFFPRWVFLLPAVLLLPTAFFRLCRVPLLLLIVATLFPLMGFCIGWQGLLHRSVTGLVLRVVTFNLHEIPLSTPGFKEYLNQTDPDVLLLEEIPTRMPRSFLPAGLTHSARHGQLCILSKYPIHVTNILQPEIAIRYVVDTPAGPVDVIGVHLSSPHWALRDALQGSDSGPGELERNIQNRRIEAEQLRGEIDKPRDRPLIIAGDFNLVPDSPVFTANFGRMNDAFACGGLGFGWTYFHQHAIVRIDHVLFDRRAICRSCKVGPDLGSPHRPLLAELVVRGDVHGR